MVQVLLTPYNIVGYIQIPFELGHKDTPELGSLVSL